MEVALAALYRAVSARLSESGAVWGNGAYADLAPESATRPYVVFFWSGGGEANQHVNPDAEIVLTVKCVADEMATAFAGAAQLAERLNDAGRYDSDTPLDGGADWWILTTTQERAVHLAEIVGNQRVYHEGFMLRVVMESR